MGIVHCTEGVCGFVQKRVGILSIVVWLFLSPALSSRRQHFHLHSRDFAGDSRHFRLPRPGHLHVPRPQVHDPAEESVHPRHHHDHHHHHSTTTNLPSTAGTRGIRRIASTPNPRQPRRRTQFKRTFTWEINEHHSESSQQ
jgi:hypothetical protein